MASRMRARCNDKAGMIRMAQAVAAEEGTTQYLTPRYYGVDFSDRPGPSGYFRIEPNGEVWQHSCFERGGPDGPVAPKLLIPGNEAR